MYYVQEDVNVQLAFTSA